MFTFGSPPPTSSDPLSAVAHDDGVALQIPEPFGSHVIDKAINIHPEVPFVKGSAILPGTGPSTAVGITVFQMCRGLRVMSAAATNQDEDGKPLLDELLASANGVVQYAILIFACLQRGNKTKYAEDKMGHKLIAALEQQEKYG